MAANKNGNKKGKGGILEKDLAVGGTGLAEKALFAKYLSVMLKSGLTIIEALVIAQDATKGKLKSVLDEVLRSVKSGRSLSSAFSEHPKVFSRLFINAVYAGERSGTLVENLENIAEELEKERALISKIRGAMLYPIFVLIATFGLGLALAFFVLPQITPLFEGLGEDLPATTEFLIWFSHFIEENALELIAGIIFSAFFLVWLIRQKFSKPVTHWMLLHIPIVKKIIYSSNIARFARTLAVLLKSGVNIDEAMEITKSTMSNYYYRQAVAVMSREVSQGVKFSESIAQFDNLFPKLVIGMIRVGEESGKFEETLFYLVSFYETETDESTKSLSTAIEPILLLLIGSVVGFLAMSIITPIYDITGNVQR